MHQYKRTFIYSLIVVLIVIFGLYLEMIESGSNYLDGRPRGSKTSSERR